MLHHGLDAAENEVGVLDHTAVVGGDIGLALGTVDDQRVDLVQVLGGQLHRRGEARAAQTHQAAGTHRILEGLQVRDLGGGHGGVGGLLPVGDDDHRGLLGPIGPDDGSDAIHLAGHAGVDVRGDKAAGLAHHGTHIDLISLFHRGRGGRSDVLGHGQDNLGGQRHHYCLQIGSPLLMWDRRTVCGSLEKIAHSDFDLPMTAIALTGRYLPFVCGPPVLTCVCLGALDMPGTAFWMRFVSPFVRPGMGTGARQNPPVRPCV